MYEECLLWTLPQISSFDDTTREEEAEYLEVVFLFTPSIYIFSKIHYNLRAGAARRHPLPDPAAEPRQQGAADLRHLHHPAQTQAVGHSGGHQLVMHCTVYLLCTVVMLVVNRALLRVLDPHMFLWSRNPGRVLQL